MSGRVAGRLRPHRNRASAWIAAGAFLAATGCTALLGDGQYYVVGDGGEEGGGADVTTDGASDGTSSGPGADATAGSDSSDSASGTDGTVLADGAGGGDGGADGRADADASADVTDAETGPTQVCSPGGTRCAGDAVETCSADGGQWGNAVGCGPGVSMCSAGNCVAPPSCRAGGSGLTDCGVGGESCCTTQAVTGGTFYRTYAIADGGLTGQVDPATVSSFRLDKYLVTVGRFRQFRDAVLPPDGGPRWSPPIGSGIHTHVNGGRGLVGAVASPDAGPTYETGWRSAYDSRIDVTDSHLTSCDWAGGPYFPYSTWTPAAGANENLPMDCIRWEEAYAFCIWDGGFLPSEAEWEYAAAGGGEQRMYPWGSTSPGTANDYAIYGCNYPGGTGQCACTDAADSGTCDGVVDIAPVGNASKGAGLWGQLDLTGEMWEWNLDFFLPYTTPCTDCANLTPTSVSDYQVLRGGGFGYPYASYGVVSTPDPSLPTSRDTFPASDRSFIRGFGFRCARAPSGP